jgi:dihydrofolate reductase
MGMREWAAPLAEPPPITPSTTAAAERDVLATKLHVPRTRPGFVTRPRLADRLAGSAELAQTLMKCGLVDEYRLMLHPIVLGGGKKLFRDGAAVTPMQLIDLKASTTGLVLLTYRPDTQAAHAAKPAGRGAKLNYPSR